MPTIAEFLPQAWIKDDAVEVDAEGPRTWEIGDLTKQQIGLLHLDSETRDNLRFHPNAPQWVRDWDGPFEIYVYEEGDDG